MSEISQELQPLFNPENVAVIGASSDWNKWGSSTFASVLNGFKGQIYPINKREKEIMGHKAYASVLDVPGKIDLAIFVIPAAGVPAVMEECVQKSISAAVIISAGFREIGEEGQQLEDEVLSIAKKGGIRFVGPNCMGMWSAISSLRAYMFAIPSMDGPAAFITQGGNVGGAIAGSAYERGLGLRGYVSCGPAADIQLEDYIEYFGEDDHVKVIMLYIEGVNDGRRFLEKAARVTRKKPVIVYKPGTGKATAQAILSHSGSLAGSDEIFDKAMKKAGITRVHGPDELLDVAIGFLTQPLPMGRNIGILTGGGSYGVICAQDCESMGLTVANLPQKTIEDLNTMFPPRWSHGNPIDPAGDRNFIAYYLAPGIVLDLDEIDALIFMGFGSIAGLSQLFEAGESQMFINRIPQMLQGLDGLDEMAGIATDALARGDTHAFRQLSDPLLPVITSMFGSDTRTINAFIDILLSGPQIRMALSRMLTDGLHALNDTAMDMEKILGIFDDLISCLLSHFMKTYAKPVLTTTFREVPQTIYRGGHPYTSSKKAVTVLSMLIRYREYLEKNKCFRDAFQCCDLLNNNQDP
ncbi:MAG: CoA-binding protein [Thermodesulfobacteriota bacterium]|nr:CoA-binding protein [Thermodesulfobacteriota bacterium]